MSRYWPPLMPSVACASSRPAAGEPYDSASRNASASSASPARIAVASSYFAHVLGRPRRSSSSSSAGRSSWTSENACTSSSDAAAGRAASGSVPAASAVARQITARTRLPPSSAYRTASSSAPSSGVSARSWTYSSASARSSSGLLMGLLLRPPSRLGELRLYLARDLGQLRQDLDRGLRILGRLEPLARDLEAAQELLRAAERALRPRPEAAGLAHGTRSRTIRPRMPLTSRAASS